MEELSHKAKYIAQLRQHSFLLSSLEFDYINYCIETKKITTDEMTSTIKWKLFQLSIWWNDLKLEILD